MDALGKVSKLGAGVVEFILDLGKEPRRACSPRASRDCVSTRYPLESAFCASAEFRSEPRRWASSASTMRRREAVTSMIAPALRLQPSVRDSKSCRRGDGIEQAGPRAPRVVNEDRKPSPFVISVSQSPGSGFRELDW